MRNIHFFFSFVLWMMVVGCLLLGMGFLGIYYFSFLQLSFFQFLLQTPAVFLVLGGSLLTVAVGLLISFWKEDSRPYFQVRMKKENVETTVDRFLIQRHVELYWREVFPQQTLGIEVLFHSSGFLECMAEIPLNSLADTKGLLEKVEKDLSLLFSEQLSYEKEFRITFFTK